MSLLHFYQRNNINLYSIAKREFERVQEPSQCTYAILSRVRSHDNGVNTVKDHCIPPGLSASDLLIKIGERVSSLGVTHIFDSATCVDQTSADDLHEAVNGSSSRLHGAYMCVVYLEDLDVNSSLDDTDALARCKYWTCSWTLAELVIPSRVEFYDRQWNRRFSKSDTEFSKLISSISGIPRSVLLDPARLSDTAAAVKLSWSANRSSSRPEDVAYSLVSILGVELTVRYGEGQVKSFQRLQEAFLRVSQDGSILLWDATDGENNRGLLARYPFEFRRYLQPSYARFDGPWAFAGKVDFTNEAVKLEATMRENGHYILLNIGGQPVLGSRIEPQFAITFRKSDHGYVRHNVTPSHGFVGELSRMTLEIVKDMNDNKSCYDFFPSQRSLPTWSLDSRFCSVCINSMGSTSRQSSDLQIGYRCADRHFEENWLSDDSISICSGGSNTDNNLDTPTCERWDSARLNRLNTREEYHLFQNNSDELVALLFSEANDFAGFVTSTKRLEEKQHLLGTFEDTFENPNDSILDEYADSDDDQAVVISHLQRQDVHFACPFYIYDPWAHLSCLENCDFRSIEDIMRHLRRIHMLKPPYCSVCCQTFERVIERDIHCGTAQCSPGSNVIVGLSEKQMRLLVEHDSERKDGIEGWVYVWETAFPNTLLARSPYLIKHHERSITKLRDFWRSRGQSIVSKFLNGMALKEKAESIDVKVLCDLVWGHAVQQLSRETHA
jgi:hypothetical protein